MLKSCTTLLEPHNSRGIIRYLGSCKICTSTVGTVVARGTFVRRGTGERSGGCGGGGGGEGGSGGGGSGMVVVAAAVVAMAVAG